MNKIVKGAALLEMQAKPTLRGIVKFPVIKEYEKRKVCSVQLVDRIQIPTYYQLDGLNNNKAGSFSLNPFFLNLFDNNGYQFCTNAPLWMFASPIQNGLQMFEPRLLDWNLCNIVFTGVSAASFRTVLLNLFFA